MTEYVHVDVTSHWQSKKGKEEVPMAIGILTEAEIAKMECLPRPEPVSLAGRESLKTPWDFYKSIFKTYKPDTQAVLDDCFEIDWAMTKCEKVIRGDGEAAKVKAYLKSQYKYIREAYKYYSGVSPQGRMPCMMSGTIGEMFSNCPDFLDGKSIKISDIDLQVIACNGGRKSNNWLSPNNALVRFQILEVLVRLSVDKYIKTNVCQTYSEAV